MNWLEAQMQGDDLIQLVAPPDWSGRVVLGADSPMVGERVFPTSGWVGLD
jgi:hypothetical protein